MPFWPPPWIIDIIKWVPTKLGQALQLWLRADKGVYSGNAASFVAASSQSLSRADNASLRVGSSDATWAFWFNVTAATNGMTFMDKYGASGAREWRIYYDSTNGLSMFASNDGAAVVSAAAPLTAVPGVWYFGLAQYELATKKISLSVNGGTFAVSAAAATAGIFGSATAFSIGNSAGGGFLGGRMDGVGFWKRLLTTGEIASLYNTGLGLRYQQLPAALLTSLISWWDLEEPSGTRKDSHTSGNDLTSNNSVGIADGVSPYRALACAAASSQSLSRASTSTLQGGNKSFTFALWVNLTDLTATRMVFSKDDTTTAREYYLRFITATNVLNWQVFNGTSTLVGDVSSAAVSAGGWIFVVVAVDITGNLVSIQLNNGTVVTAALTGTPGTTTTAFYLGARAANPLPLNGMADQVGKWDRLLTTAEIASLYNAGMGLQYSQLPANLLTNLQAWWDLEEVSGTRNDASGNGNHLTANNAPGSVIGVVPALTAAVVGDAVRAWLDQSGRGNHAYQITATKRPTLALVSGRLWMFFDGVDDHLPLLGFKVAAGEHTALLVVNPATATGSNKRFFDSLTGRLILAQLSSGIANKIAWFESVTGVYRDIADAALGAQILTYELKATGAIYRNGVSLGTAAYAQVGVGGATNLMADNGGTQNADGYLAGVVWVSPAASTADRQKAERYLGKGSGIG